MSRTARASAARYCDHVLNRGNARTTVFHKDGDYDVFLEMIAEATLCVPMRILAYRLIPNHDSMALWPRDEGDLSRWRHWLFATPVRRYLRHDHSSGHVWQGPFKAFSIQADERLRVVLRSIECNPPPRGEAWIGDVNALMTEAECGPIRESIQRDRPLGSETWTRVTAESLGWESRLRDRGRPQRKSDFQH